LKFPCPHGTTFIPFPPYCLKSQKSIKTEDAKKKITREEAIKYYFKNKDSMSFKISDKIDKNILNIICDTSKKMKSI
jgi:hypothetical protein